MDYQIITFVLAVLVTLAHGTNWHQMFFMGDKELRAESPADAFFRGCCMKESVNDFCTNKMCSLSRIAGMTHWTFMLSVKQCKPQLKKIFKCASDNKNQTSCCAARGVPEQCSKICNGAETLRLRELSIFCARHSKSILQCFKENFVPFHKFTEMKYFLIK
ncbi:DB module family protein [Brugia pahangi]